MISSLKSILIALRQKFLIWHVEWEIYHRMFPHLEKERNSGYPFGSDEELFAKSIQAELDAKLALELIDQQADQMPKAYGQAFRYIAYRDINCRMGMYLKLAQRRVPPKLRILKYA